MTGSDEARVKRSGEELQPLLARAAEARRARESGLRRTRRLSVWTLAALAAGVGVTSASLAHALPTGIPASGVSPSQSGAGSANAVGAPRLGGAVASSSGSTVVAGASGAGPTPAGAPLGSARWAGDS